MSVRRSTEIGKHIRGSDKRGHERRGGLVIDLVSRSHLLDLAVVHDDDLVGELERLLLVVRHEEAGDAQLPVKLVEPVPQLLADACVEGAEWFVEQEHLRARRERTGQGDALALAAGELVRVSVRERRQPDELEEFLHPLLLRVLVDLANRQAEGDVPPHGHVPKEGVVLEDEPEAPILHAGVRELFPGDDHASGVRLLEAGDHPKHRALPRSAGAEQRGDGSLGGSEADLVHRLERAEGLAQPPDLDAACHYRASLEVFRLNVSIPIRSTIENSASVRATTYPWGSWYWSKARRM